VGPRGFWVALAIVLFYLIARPHVGTVWYVNAESATRNNYEGESSELLDAIKGVSPSPSPSPSLSAKPVPVPPTRFVDKRDCFGALSQYQQEANVTGAVCASTNALLWGW
jgi:hypothetical protein